MEKVISYVNTNRGTGRKESLERLYLLLEALDNPHKSLKYIHITGTNGKGSTGALFASILRETGLNVGVFTSPHLEIVNERIRINEEFISDEDFIRMVLAIEPLVLNLEKEMGEKFYAFELLTTVAFLYFQEKQPDIVILEAGIGGRLDATNVIEEAEVSIVTSIGLDHMHVLGETKEEIMLEKVAILKEAGDLVVGPVEANLKEIAKRQADLVNGSVTFIEPIDIEVEETSLKGQVFAYKEWKNLKLSLLGLHQIENASIVLEACEILKEKGWSLPSKMIYRGLEQAHWPGRFEKVLNEPLFYLDGAHNEASVKRLVETLEEVFPNKTFYFVIGMMQDKAYEKMIKEVAHLAEEFILVSPDWQRGFDVNEVAKDLLTAGYPALAKDSVEEVLHYIQQDIPKTATVIQFGSLYLVGDLKRALHMD
jgi:dihydrofolate synthase/folylpolyglutamate synthase